MPRETPHQAKKNLRSSSQKMSSVARIRRIRKGPSSTLKAGDGKESSSSFFLHERKEDHLVDARIQDSTPKSAS